MYSGGEGINVMTNEEHVKYWVEESSNSWKDALHLLKGKRNALALFCFHLTLEKLFKALWIRNNDANYPPRVHNLIFLHDESKANLSEELQDELRIINSWNLEGRYPQYQFELSKTITENYIQLKLEIVKEIIKCLQEKLQ